MAITSSQPKEQNLAIDRESGEYTFNKKPCPFLRSNLCSCYPNRPETCASYPHLHKPDFIFRLINVIGNYSLCPIVFNTYEHLKDELSHHHKANDLIQRRQQKSKLTGWTTSFNLVGFLLIVSLSIHPWQSKIKTPATNLIKFPE